MVGARDGEREGIWRKPGCGVRRWVPVVREVVDVWMWRVEKEEVDVGESGKGQMIDCQERR